MGSREEKAALRQRYRKARSETGESERRRADALIAHVVRRSDAYVRARMVLTYLSFASEVDTRALIEDAWAGGKVVALPRCVPGTRQMRWYRVESLDGLARSSLGMEEPLPDPAREVDPARVGEPACALVPALAFDAHGGRLGYGAGFYDTFLATFAGTTIGLCRETQLSCGRLPREPHDVAVHLVATEERLILCKKCP